MDTAQRDDIEASTEGFALQLGLPYFDTRPKIDIKPLVGKLTLVGMEAYGIVPLQLEGNVFTIGTSEETDRDQLESLRHRLAGYQVQFAFISQFGCEPPIQPLLGRQQQRHSRQRQLYRYQPAIAQY